MGEWGGSKGSIGDQKCWFCQMKGVVSGGGPRSGFASRGGQIRENPENPGFNNYYCFMFFMPILYSNNTFKFLIGFFRSGLA